LQQNQLWRRKSEQSRVHGSGGICQGEQKAEHEQDKSRPERRERTNEAREFADRFDHQSEHGESKQVLR
jgi:hypothetical protein